MRAVDISLYSQDDLPYSLPRGKNDLNRLTRLSKENVPFTFVRFSDGEIEILRNRKLVIADGVTQFRGKYFSNNFPVFDQKRFDPLSGKAMRADLILSATYCDKNYFKGIPTSHNRAINDREFLLRLNGGFTPQMTFSDLFLNSNYLHSRNDFFPSIVDSSSNLYVVGNFRCQLRDYLAKGTLISIPDNFFSCYEEALSKTMDSLFDIPDHSLVLSSASSLSNVLGHQLRLARPDITFIDIGTALNDLMGLSLGTRAYHSLVNPTGLRKRFAAWRYRHHREYQLQW